MEPLEVLRDMLRSGDFDTIGGAPQVGKVFPYLQSALLPLYWPDSSGEPHVGGRPALPYEVFSTPIIDPEARSAHAAMPEEAADDWTDL